MAKIIVTGGGAAGMMAAAAAAERGNQVILFEKNEKLGKKLFITGKGRCNLTNACEPEKLFDYIITNPRFLYSAFHMFDNEAVIRYFEEAGLKTKTERGERVFPVSDHSSDVTAALSRRLKELHVEVRTNSPVAGVITENGSVLGVRQEHGKKEAADAVILATGGLSYPSTGSTGDGYRMAVKMGHTLIKTAPCLVPLKTAEEWGKKLQGLSLKNVTLSLGQGGEKPFYEGFGEMLFTHFGVSGPLVLSASSYYAGRKNKRDCKLWIDLKPALSVEQLDKRICRDFEENSNRQFKNALGGLFPAKLIPVMIELSGIDAEKTVNRITREERNHLVFLTKHLEMSINGTGDYEEAVITRGGICVKEVNPSTMESKLVKGLYFAGEMLDLDALTGGFNLQIAWSTGYLAGNSAG